MASTPQKIRSLQQKLYLASKQKGNYRFYSLYDKIYRLDILLYAYKLCKTNGGAPGIDGKTFEDIERTGLDTFLREISEDLRRREYEPAPIRRVMIPKGNGKERPLGISNIRERVVETACKIVMEPIFEPHFHQHSYGYRPRRRAQQAVMEIEKAIKNGYVHVYDADLVGYFDNIPHQPLMEKLARKISDQAFLALIKKFLTNPVRVTRADGTSHSIGSTVGTPQGNCLSPLLANIYLNDFCLLIASKTPCLIISYADDFVIMHKKPFTKAQTEWFAKSLEKEELQINTEKTKIRDMTQSGSGFDFLGFSLKNVQGFYGTRKRYVKIQPSQKSQEKLKENIRGVVKHRTSLTLEQLIARVNRILRGWHNYFKELGYPRSVFFKMDWFVIGRFYRWSMKRSQRGSKYLTQDAWRKLRLDGLMLLQPCGAKATAKGARRRYT